MVSVMWCARRGFDEVAARRARVAPVRIAAGALGGGVPERAVSLGADQALVTARGVVAAGHLVEGRLVTREAAGAVMYVTLGVAGALVVAGMACLAGRHPVCARAAGAARRAMAGGEPLEALRGRVETVSRRRVVGYALDGAGPVALEVAIDGVAVAWGMADRPRPDLAMAGLGDGAIAFDIGFDMPGDGGLIEVRRVADGSRLEGAALVRSRGCGSLAEAMPAAADAAAGLDVAVAVLRGIDGAILAAGLHGPFGTGMGDMEMRG